MKNWKLVFTVMAFTAIFGFVGCGGDDDNNGDKDLTGNISISPTTATVGTELTATYSGTETVNYKWNKSGTAINGETATTFTPSEIGSYTVTVSLSGYKSKTSGAVTVGEATPIEKTYTIELTVVRENQPDKPLTFVVNYEAMPGADAPTYLSYIDGRLKAFISNASAMNTDAVDDLLIKGNRFTINVENTESVYGGLLWDNATQAFKVHNDWISTAEGVSGDNALTLVMMRETFRSAVAETAMLNANDTKAPVVHAKVSATEFV